MLYEHTVTLEPAENSIEFGVINCISHISGSAQDNETSGMKVTLTFALKIHVLLAICSMGLEKRLRVSLEGVDGSVQFSTRETATVHMLPLFSSQMSTCTADQTAVTANNMLIAIISRECIVVYLRSGY
jgi:hypothetical protein